MKQSADEIKKMISASLPEGRIVTAHNEKGHFYKDTSVEHEPYPSVTGRLQILKDESLINYKMNQAIQYVFRKYKQFTDENIMEHLDLAARASQDVLVDAGDIGTQIHNARERFFTAWIKSGVRPASAQDFIDPAVPDVRVKSALRALDAFCTDYSYVPVATEVCLINHELKLGGALDDLGIMRRIVNTGNKDCAHDVVGNHCVKCDYKEKWIFVLMDIKTSNQFKDHYFFQVALYYWMFFKLTGLRVDECFILKLSKEDGTYKIEDLKRPAMLASYARSMLRMHKGIEFVKQLRKDNQKVVAEKLEL